MRIFLAGPPGAGKTTVGEALAKRQRLPHFDTDALLKERTGMDPPTLFRHLGEVHYRAAEKAILSPLLAQNTCVVSLGGGLFYEGISWVYLTAPLEELYRRRGATFTLTEGKEPFFALCKRREPLYKKNALYTIDTSSRSIHDCVDLILETYGVK